MRAVWFFFFIIIILCSCNTERSALNKYARLKANHPDLFKTDSIIVVDTINVNIIDSIIIGTSEIQGEVPESDSIIENDKFSIEFYLDKFNKMMFNAKTKADTIYIDRVVSVPYEKTFACPEYPRKQSNLLYNILIIVIVAYLINFLHSLIFRR